MLKIFLCLSILLLSACSEKIIPINQVSIPADSQYGVVLLKAKSIVPQMSLSIAMYKNDKSQLTSPQYIIQDRDRIVKEQPYFAMRVRAGNYAVVEFRQQYYWSTCFHANTLSFNVPAGRVLYMGEFEPASHIQQLTDLILSSGKTTARVRKNQFGAATSADNHTYFDNILPPEMVLPDETSLKEAQLFISENLPNLSSDISIPEYKKAFFHPGTNLSGSELCKGPIDKPYKVTP